MNNACRVVLEDITVRYGKTTALGGVSLEFDEGLHILYGPNGSGKTTLLRVVAGLVKPDSGSVAVCGEDPRRMLFRGRRIISGLIGQELLPFWLKTGQYLSLFQSLLCSERKRECEDTLDLLGVRGFYHAGMASLSSGMAKKVLLSLSFMSPSSILLLDEPFTYIDAETRSRVVKAIERVKNGRIVIVATHFIPGDLDVDRIVFLDDGVVRRVIDRRDVYDVEDYIVYAELKVNNIDNKLIKYLFEELRARSLLQENGHYYVLVNGRGLRACVEAGVCSGKYRLRLNQA